MLFLQMFQHVTHVFFLSYFAFNVGTFPEAPDTFSVGGAPPGTSAVEVPVITSTAITGGGVPSPSAVALPPGSSQQMCQTFQSACVSSDTTSAPFQFTVTLTCLPGSTAQVCQPSHTELCLSVQLMHIALDCIVGYESLEKSCTQKHTVP